MSAPDLDTDLLRAFVAVAEHRSFTKAAVALNRTQSAVSMQVRRLEERLGTEVLHRSTTSVSLSLSGETRLAYARRILSLNDEAVDRLREQRVEGVVRLGVMEDYGMQLLPPILAAFTSRNPGIHIQMETGLTAFMTDRLGESYDLVLAMHPEGQGDGTLLRRDRAVWAASPQHLCEWGEALPLALYPPGCLFRKWAMEALDEAGRPWRLAFVSHSLGAVESFVRHGLALTVVKASTMPRTLVKVPPQTGLPALPGADIRLHRAARIPKAADVLADHIGDALANSSLASWPSSARTAQ